MLLRIITNSIKGLFNPIQSANEALSARPWHITVLQDVVTQKSYIEGSLWAKGIYELFQLVPPSCLRHAIKASKKGGGGGGGDTETAALGAFHGRLRRSGARIWSLARQKQKL